MRKRARGDANQTEIVSGLRRIGASVAITSQLGDGFTDLVVGWRGLNFLFEVKNPAQPPSKRKLTDDEQDFHDSWRGQVHVVESVEDALAIMQTVLLSSAKMFHVQQNQ